ncbi:MAG TPA: choice-of-anchor Q domain-containing protein [Gemmatimonadaceae bacterium]|nr:choice-of-anchor Q domain-containing protein [Gemmatimonadaceae bacterium]
MKLFRSLILSVSAAVGIGCGRDLTTGPIKVPRHAAAAEVAGTCENLQDALDNSSPGDVIVMAEGSVCTGHYELPQHAITLDGGATGATFDGGNATQILAGRDVGNTVIRGLTFINGNAREGSDTQYRSGGALHIEGRSTPYISHCVFVSNRAQGQGGAIYFTGDQDATIENSNFRDNSASEGGAVFMAPIRLDVPEPLGQLYLRDNIFGSTTEPNFANPDHQFPAPFALGPGGAVFVRTAAQVSLTGNTFSGNHGGDGGGLYVDADAANVTGNVLTNNTASGSGGGFYLEARTGVISRNTLAGNSASSLAGGAAILGKQIGESRFSDIFTLDANIIKNNSNTAASDCGRDCAFGGGLFAARVRATLTSNTLSGNSAAAGGGLFVRASAFSVTGSTISGNTALSDAGGIYLDFADLSATNSTISSNNSARGGGVYASDGSTVSFHNATIADNRVTNATGGGLFSDDGTVFATSSIFARNLGSGSAPANCAGNGFFAVGGDHNLEDADTCGLNSVTGDGDLVGANPNLGPLADNGGPTFTHALGAGRAAIDAGSDVGCPAVDQRGEGRPKDGDGNGTATCDIGAFEQATTLPGGGGGGGIPGTGITTKQLKINFGSHGGENAMSWSGSVIFVGAINPLTEPVTIRLTSGGASVFSTTIVPGNFVRESDGSYRFRSPKKAQPELDIRFKPRVVGWDFTIGVDNIEVTVKDRTSIQGTISVGTKAASQTLPLTDKGKSVEYKAR